MAQGGIPLGPWHPLVPALGTLWFRSFLWFLQSWTPSLKVTSGLLLLGWSTYIVLLTLLLLASKGGDEVGDHLNPTGRGVGRHCQGESDWHLKEHRRRGGWKVTILHTLKGPLLFWGASALGLLCPERQHQFPSCQCNTQSKFSLPVLCGCPLSPAGKQKDEGNRPGLSQPWGPLCFWWSSLHQHPCRRQASYQQSGTEGASAPRCDTSVRLRCQVSFFFSVDLLRNTGQGLGSVKRILAGLFSIYVR